MALLLLAGGAWVISWIALELAVALFGRRWVRLSEWGDAFGAVNALFSALAFAGLVYAIVLQRRELALQRKELRATRAELKGQREQLEAQNATFLRQSFENTFFQLLRLHIDIVNATVFTPSAPAEATLTGRAVFEFLYQELAHSYESQPASIGNDPEGRQRVVSIDLAYNQFYAEYQRLIGHYFRNLYHIFKFIRGSAVADKRRYAAIVRAQLSVSELHLLFYAGLSEHGREKFRPLIEEYELLAEPAGRGATAPSTHWVLRSERVRVWNRAELGPPRRASWIPERVNGGRRNVRCYRRRVAGKRDFPGPGMGTSH